MKRMVITHMQHNLICSDNQERAEWRHPECASMVSELSGKIRHHSRAGFTKPLSHASHVPVRKTLSPSRPCVLQGASHIFNLSIHTTGRQCQLRCQGQNVAENPPAPVGLTPLNEGCEAWCGDPECAERLDNRPSTSYMQRIAFQAPKVCGQIKRPSTFVLTPGSLIWNAMMAGT